MKHRRSRKEIKMQQKTHYNELAESKPAPAAVEAFRRQAYPRVDVLGYVAEKYGIGRGEAIGQEDTDRV